jgi:hypothetical protein
MKIPLGITRLRFALASNNTVFEHGKTDNDKRIFIGACTYEVWGPRLVTLKVEKLEV